MKKYNDNDFVHKIGNPNLSLTESPSSYKRIWVFDKRDIVLYVFVLLLWVTFMSLFTDFSGTFCIYWYFIPFGIMGATIAMSTPAGGGLVFFPVLIRFGFAPQEVVAFSLATETIGMGFGSIRWLIEDFKAFQWKVIISTIPGGWIGLYLGTMVIPIQSAKIARLIFSLVGLSLCILTLYTHYRRKGFSNTEINVQFPHIISFFIVGIIGGFITSYIGFGVDLYIFFFIVLLFSFSIHKGTVSSIIIIASNAPLGFFLHAHYLNTIRWEFWQMVIPGVLTGAVIGPKLLRSVGEKRMMYGLCTLLFLEFVVTVFFRI